MTSGYIINNIILPLDASFSEAFSVAEKKLEKIGVKSFVETLKIYKKSIDARRKNDIKFVYSVLALGSFPELNDSILKTSGISKYKVETPDFRIGSKALNSDIVVVGSGPAGLFAALTLAEAGFKPILIERGGSVEERRSAIKQFEKTRVLDTSTNIQFGAGGAGTFSDGKLVTRIADSMSSYILSRLVEFGAPAEIEFLSRPHIGTDILSNVVSNILDRIVSLGGEVRFHTTLIGYNETAGRITSVVTDKGSIPCSLVVLAVGHSARDTYSLLINHGADLIAKPFSVGMRIEHPTELIDRGLYGDFAGHPELGHAEYNLSYNTKERGVYTFCMCPGGEVVAATSEEGGVVTNGMSYHSRSGKNSNSAVLCSVFREDYGSTPMAAIDFQREIERQAFRVGGVDYSAPYCTVGDFLSNNYSTSFSRVQPTYMHGSVKLADPEKYLPHFVADHIRRGIVHFDKKIPGFASSDAILTGAETRTSAPIRIVRNNETRLATGFANLYPAGEGAGYAGGITSAAIDGLKTALKVISIYKPNVCG